MKKHLVMLIIFFLVSPISWAAELLKVGISPLVVYIPKKSPRMGEDLSLMLSQKIKNPKIKIVPWKGEIVQKIEEARKEGEKQGLDYVIMGSLTQIGEKISLDLAIVETGGIKPPVLIYKEIPSMEKLEVVSTEIAQELVYKLLKKKRITRLEIIGNKSVDKEAILAVMQTKEGEIFDPKIIRRDIKSIFKMGFFKDIRVEVEDFPEGEIVKFIVSEKPVIKQIIIEGNKVIKDSDIREVIALKVNSILKEHLITKSVEQIKALYQKEGYFDAQVEYKIIPITSEKVKLTFIIKEGEKAYIKKIIFEGNKAFKDKTLKKQMKNKERWFLSFITGSGKLKTDELENDVNRIANFYYNHGYINVKIGEPQVERRGTDIYITIPVEEGEQYKVGKIAITGDLLKPETELKKILKLKSGAVYNREQLQKDITALSDVYASEGFAYVEIEPEIKVNSSTLSVDVVYHIKKGIKVYVGRIEFEGNTKTRDKVLRRELWIGEGETFNKIKIEKSIEALHRLGYFEDVKLETQRGEEPNEVNLKIKVKEQPTGSFSIGAGYSSIENFIIMADITQRNLFGRGQKVTLRGYIGSVTQRYTFDFTEPYLFDSQLSTGFQAFKWDTEYIDFTKESSGGEIRLSYPLGYYSRIYSTYHYEKAKTADFNEEIASKYITELADGIATSSIRLSWRRDTRNRFFNPSKGMVLSGSIEYAGGFLGGDSAFNRYEGSASIFIPLFWNTVGFIRTKVGYIDRRGKGILPLFEKYYLGGPNTIRGYDFATISPRDPETGERIGGNKMFLCNLEYRFPIFEKIRLFGVVFFDAGNSYDINQSFDLTNLKKSVGMGVRWFSPMGPIRLEFGFALNAEEDESTSNWEFAMGTFF